MDPLTEDQQVHVDKLIGDARSKAREKAKADAEDLIAKERETAMSVAKQARQELDALNVSKTAELEEMAASMLEDAVKQVGSKAKTAIEALPSTMVAIEKLKWLRVNRELFQAQGDGVGTPASGTKLNTVGEPLAGKKRVRL